MKTRVHHDIDLFAPGGLTALFEFHRKTFGDAVMEDGADGAQSNDGGNAGQQNGDKGGQSNADGDKPLGEAGIKALTTERDARKAAEKRASEAEAALQKIEDAKLSDIDKANKERDATAAENATLKATNARLAALAKHPVPEEYQDLVTGTDEASYLASAKKISELHAKAEGKASKPDPVPGSGTGDRKGVSGRDAGLEQARKRGFIKD
ncbi:MULTISPECIES: hypothetical protein [Arthrobacter]|uniref:Scaffolding protein n=1 Tax=Arthrobacter terricola TaxID=2547396 RepID=A0A4R5KC01_9MICC|nr:MULTISPECIES: hypothetical protein [Arthrobacter]MBT8162803.1 hypothetical protein [Arthrobacter sp. GN70]TDF92038.1 hypothetical protein E1809_18840 [Arthrobacter terricola]